MKKEHGAFTLEAVIVMSTIIFIIFAIIMAFLLIYQNAVMYYVATQAAQEGAVMWSDPARTLDGTGGGAGDRSLNYYYHRIGEFFGGGGISENKSKISNWAKQKLKELTPNTIVGSGAETVKVEFHNYVLVRIVEVSITKEINIPFKEIARYFNADLDMSVSAKATVADAPEYIRNVDYGMELAGELWKLVSGKLGDLFNANKGS